jgi:hypothetical protein
MTVSSQTFIYYQVIPENLGGSKVSPKLHGRVFVEEKKGD